MKKAGILLLLITILLVCSHARASQDIYIDLEELTRDANLYYKVNCALFAAFTSHANIAQGTFTAKYEGEDDGSLDIFKFPIPIYFNKGSKIQPLLKITYGYSRYSRWYDPYDGEYVYEEDIGKKEKLLIQTHSIGLTTGIKFEYLEGFFIEPLIGAYYSHINHQNKTDLLITKDIIEQYPSLYRDYYDTTVEVISIAPALRHSIDYSLGPGSIGLDVHYILQHSKSIRSKSRYADVSSTSSILHTMLDYEMPTGQSLFGRDVALKPFVARTDFFGDIKTGMGMNHLYEYGMNLIFDVGNVKSLFSRVSLGGSYIKGHEFYGWKFGLSFM